MQLKYDDVVFFYTTDNNEWILDNLKPYGRLFCKIEQVNGQDAFSWRVYEYDEEGYEVVFEDKGEESGMDSFYYACSQAVRAASKRLDVNLSEKPIVARMKLPTGHVRYVAGEAFDDLFEARTDEHALDIVRSKKVHEVIYPIYQVLTSKEAADLYDIKPPTLNKWITRDQKYRDGDVRKSGATWLLSKKWLDSMTR